MEILYGYTLLICSLNFYPGLRLGISQDHAALSLRDHLLLFRSISYTKMKITTSYLTEGGFLLLPGTVLFCPQN